MPIDVERDHPKFRQARDRQPGPRLEQFRCDMCGGAFLLRASFERHKVGELGPFIAESAAKNAAWVARRARPALVGVASETRLVR